MISRILRSIRFRIDYRFRESRIAKYRAIAEALPPLKIVSKPETPFTLLQFVGRDQSRMMQQCLRSIAMNWSKIPPLLIISDGSISPEELESQVTWWPMPVRAESWEAAASRMVEMGRPELKKIAEKHPLGKKLCAILDHAIVEPLLFCDSDILWFKGPPSFPDHARGGAAIRLTSDMRRSYDENLISAMKIEELNQLPNLNSGVVYAAGDLYESLKLRPITEYAAEHTEYFSEQTILSTAARRYGFAPWTLDEVMLKVDDVVRFARPSYARQQWLARHYVGTVRHWFWYDAIAMSSTNGCAK